MRPRTIVAACASLLLLLSCSGNTNRNETMDQWRTRDGTNPAAKVEPTPPQTAKSHAKTKKQIHSPVNVAEPRTDEGQVDQHNDANITAKSENWNAWQSLKQSQAPEVQYSNERWSNDVTDGQAADGASQTGIMSDDTGQHASDAKTPQINVTAPTSVHTVAANTDVSQHKDAERQAKSEGNEASPKLDQNPEVEDSEAHSHGDCNCSSDSSDSRNGISNDHDSGDGASQDGKVENSTVPEAQSPAESEPVNVNVPISVSSVGSNPGDVSRGNPAEPHAKSENGTEKWQHAHENQVQGNDHGSHNGCGHDGRDDSNGKSEDWNRDGQDASASQSGKVDNETDRSASSDAQTKQFNPNAPSGGRNNGEMNQGNVATASAHSSNGSDIGQPAGHQPLIG
jgi:hypothetical protein